MQTAQKCGYAFPFRVEEVEKIIMNTSRGPVPLKIELAISNLPKSILLKKILNVNQLLTQLSAQPG